MSRRVRITFYGREEYVDLPADDAEYQTLLDAAKRLASRKTDVPSHYRVNVSTELAAIIAIAEIQCVIFIEDAPDDSTTTTVVNVHGILREPGAALYLKGRQQPIVLHTARLGPFDEMVAELTSFDYGEHDMGCVMLADGKSNPVFLVLDELQYALISRELLDE